MDPMGVARPHTTSWATVDRASTCFVLRLPCLFSQDSKIRLVMLLQFEWLKEKKLWNQRLVGQFNSQLVMLMLLLTILQSGPPTSYKWPYK